MNDAAELLLTIYEHVRAVAAKQGLPAGVEVRGGRAGVVSVCVRMCGCVCGGSWRCSALA